MVLLTVRAQSLIDVDVALTTETIDVALAATLHGKARSLKIINLINQFINNISLTQV